MQTNKPLPQGHALVQKVISGPLADFEKWIDQQAPNIQNNVCDQIHELEEALANGKNVTLNREDDVFSTCEIVPDEFIKLGVDKYLHSIVSVIDLKKHFQDAGYNIDIAIKKSDVFKGYALEVKVSFKDDYSDCYIR